MQATIKEEPLEEENEEEESRDDFAPQQRSRWGLGQEILYFSILYFCICTPQQRSSLKSMSTQVQHLAKARSGRRCECQRGGLAIGL